MAATRAVGHDEHMQTPTGHRILVVEDEAAIGQAIAIALGYEGFEVQTVENGRAALQAVEAFRPALVLLDVMLPDLDGFEVTRRLRDRGDDVPVVFLTARDATDDKVSGLRLGADDYVTKPFSLDELVERVRAVLRRTAGADGQRRLRFADLELDPETHEVWRASEPIQLTATEFRLLHLFMQNPRRVLSKSQILEHVWDYDFGGDANIVETYVSYLRKKIDKVDPPLLHTIRGAGYSLRVPGR
jgi:two-component system, OmpR family, response regulator